MLTIRRIFCSPLLPRYRYVSTDTAGIVNRIVPIVTSFAGAAVLAVDAVKFGFRGEYLWAGCLLLASALGVSVIRGIVLASVRSSDKRAVELTVALLTDTAMGVPDWYVQTKAYRVMHQAVQRAGRGV